MIIKRIILAIVALLSIFKYTYSIHHHKTSLEDFKTSKNTLQCFALIILDQSGAKGAQSFLSDLKIYSNSRCTLVYSKEDVSVDFLKNEFTQYVNYISMQTPFVETDYRIGITDKVKGHVYDIIWCLENAFDRFSDRKAYSKEVVIFSFAFGDGAIPKLTPGFKEYNEKIMVNSIHFDVILLGKTKKLTSMSDWHDLAVSVFRVNLQATKWFSSFKESYEYYSYNRTVFNMIDPRPALMEASFSNRRSVRVQYFSSTDICSVNVTAYHETDQLIHFSNNVSSTGNYHNSHKTNRHNVNQHCKHTHYFSILNRNISNTLRRLSAVKSSHHIKYSPIEIHCGSENQSGHDACLITGDPIAWKNIDRTISEKFKRQERAQRDPFHLLWQGGLRFRNANGSNPRKFCWDEKTNVDSETLSNSNIEYNTSYSVRFTHPDYDRYKQYHSNISAVLMVGSHGSGESLDSKKYLTISKMYYAKRHRYNFTFVTSSEVVNFFPKDIYGNLESVYAHNDYFHGVMSKPLMIMDALYRFPDNEWLIWTDDDVFINTGWLYMPLDPFLSDIPKDKVLVLANYRSAFTNVLAIRNNQRGRRLMMDWLAIVMSGYIQCHGFDQAALEALIAQRISGDNSFSTPSPLNFTCLYSPGMKLGCDGKSDWSCDFKFEKALYLAGYKTAVAAFHEGKLSSFSKGCANGAIMDFHIITETSSRPRLQCGLCTRNDEIDSAGHWDGPLGGGNMILMKGKINGYFFNHKMEFLFYETYLKPKGCKYIKSVVPKCDELGNAMKPAGSKHWLDLVSLTDGYAFDLNSGSYCILTNERLIMHQKTETYMKTYDMFTELINKFSEEDWIEKYKGFGGGYGRSPCTKRDRCNEDGQKKTLRRDEHFERENYCETCRKIPNTSPYSKAEFAIDCRTEEEEKSEIQNNINID